MASIAYSLAPGYVLHEGYPSVEDYVHLRVASGLTPKTSAQASASIAGSWHGVHITHTTSATPSQAVAMGRVIGDGGWYFVIADMAVLPEHQRRGLGDVVLKGLMEGIERRAVEGTAYICLSADEPGRKLYAKNGFVETAPKELGMRRLVNVGEKGDGEEKRVED